MAAPHIPNLNTLRSIGGRGRGRGSAGQRGINDPEAIPSFKEQADAKDKIVQQTDHDASISRLSAVNLGYLDDAFVGLLAQGEVQRRFPIINRGTYVRSKAIDDLVEQFMSTKSEVKKQIISLGAGSDTRFFRLMDKDASLRSRLIYHEIDFPANTAQKISQIRCSPILSSLAGLDFMDQNTIGEAVNTLNGPNYHITPLDLRDLSSKTPDLPLLSNVDTSVATLILSECCLIYLDPSHADSVVKYFTQHMFPASTPLGLILYEPIRPNDAFGKVMVSNLAARGIVLQTLKKYGSLEAQSARMRVYGFENCSGSDINDLWKRGISEAEKARVAELEMVDEVEEWEMLAAHYCVVWAWRGNETGLWEQWLKSSH